MMKESESRRMPDPAENVQIFGDYVEMEKVSEYMVISFSAETLAMDELWASSALSARFLSGFWGQFFPAGDTDAGQIRNDVEDSVRYITAELLGNAVKFGCQNQFMIKIGLYMINGELRFYVTNSVSPEFILEFKRFIRKLLHEDLNHLYLRQMEKSAEEGSTESRMGFLTMMLDYESRVSWKFEKEGGIDIVTTLVRLPVVRNR